MDKDVLLSIPDESIVPYSLESMVSAICVAGTYEGNNKFKLTVCVTVILKVLAQVEILIPSYGFCPIPPCEEFAENVCDEFFSLPLFPPASLCNNDDVCLRNRACNTGCNTGCKCCREQNFSKKQSAPGESQGQTAGIEAASSRKQPLCIR